MEAPEPNCRTCGAACAPADAYCRECGGQLLPAAERGSTPVQASGDAAQVPGLLDQARQALRAGQPAEAEAAAQLALALDPENAQAHALLARVCEARKEHQRAGRLWRLASTLDPAEPEYARQAATSEPDRPGRRSLHPVLVAGLSALVVFGTGLALLNTWKDRLPSESGEPLVQTPGSAPPSGANTANAERTPQRAAQATRPESLPGPPAPGAERIIVPPPNQPGPPTTVVGVPAPPVVRRLPSSQRPGMPVRRVGLPEVRDSPPRASGIPAAAIGEIIPLRRTGSTDGVDSLAPPAQGPAGAGMIAAIPPPRPPRDEPTPRPRAAPRRAGELFDSEIGFIHVETVDRGAQQATGRTPRPAGGSEGPGPGLTLTFSSTEGAGPTLPEARRLRSEGSNLARLGRFPEARRALESALQMYARIRSRGGAEGRVATVEHEECRRLLVALP